MIQTEHPYRGDAGLIRTFSDDPEKALLQQGSGAVYTEAIDTFPLRFTYTEAEKGEEQEP